MNERNLREQEILNSWNQNAIQWQELIDKDQIESRNSATNAAIIQATLQKDWKKVLDVGCGEGWLVRKLLEQNLDAVGLDGSEKLIQLAQQKSSAVFQCLSYEEIIHGASIQGAPFDGILLNFAIFDKNRPKYLLEKLATNLHHDKGSIIIQTLAPRKNDDTISWKSNAWDGLPGDFSDPYSWYHHSEPEWEAIFNFAKLKLFQRTDVIHPVNGKHLSTIFELGSPQ